MSLFAAFILTIANASAEERTAKLYELGKTEGAPLYIQKIRVDDLDGGGQKRISSITDGAGQLLMDEVCDHEGSRLQFQRVRNFQGDKIYEIAIKDGRISFKTFKGKEETGKPASEASGKVDGPVLTGAVTEAFVRERWADLAEGKRVEVSFAVMELERTIGVYLEAKRLETGPGDLVVTLRPSNFFVSMLVDPIEMTFSGKEKRLVRYRGRTPLKSEGSKSKLMDAEIIYE